MSGMKVQKKKRMRCAQPWEEKEKEKGWRGGVKVGWKENINGKSWILVEVMELIERARDQDVRSCLSGGGGGSWWKHSAERSLNGRKRRADGNLYCRFCVNAESAFWRKLFSQNQKHDINKEEEHRQLWSPPLLHSSPQDKTNPSVISWLTKTAAQMARLARGGENILADGLFERGLSWPEPQQRPRIDPTVPDYRL